MHFPIWCIGSGVVYLIVSISGRSPFYFILMAFTLYYHAVIIILHHPIEIFKRTLIAILNWFRHFNGVLRTKQCIFNGMCM